MTQSDSEQTQQPSHDRGKLLRWRDLRQEDKDLVIFSGIAILATATVVSIAMSTRKTNNILEEFRDMFEMVVRNRDADMLAMQHLISDLHKQGKTFTYYPGIGVYIDKD